MAGQPLEYQFLSLWYDSTWKSPTWNAGIEPRPPALEAVALLIGQRGSTKDGGNPVGEPTLNLHYSRQNHEARRQQCLESTSIQSIRNRTLDQVYWPTDEKSPGPCRCRLSLSYPRTTHCGEGRFAELGSAVLSCFCVTPPEAMSRVSACLVICVLTCFERLSVRTVMDCCGFACRDSLPSLQARTLFVKVPMSCC